MIFIGIIGRLFSLSIFAFVALLTAGDALPEPLRQCSLAYCTIYLRILGAILTSNLTFAFFALLSFVHLGHQTRQRRRKRIL